MSLGVSPQRPRERILQVVIHAERAIAAGGRSAVECSTPDRGPASPRSSVRGSTLWEP